MKHTLCLLSLAGLLLGFAGCSDPFRLTRRGNVFELAPERREAHFNGSLVWLTAPAGKDGALSETDRNTLVAPLLAQRTAVRRRIRTILVDPGHGGREVGAPGTLGCEKALNLALAKRLRGELEKRGFTVSMTREEDTALSLNARGGLTKERNADLFISVHHNSARGKTVSGVETYVLTPGGAASTNDPPGAAGPAPAGNRAPGDDVLLGWQIHSRLVPASGLPDRGLRFARFRVLVRSVCPAVLVEAGFISNPAEEKLLAAEEHQQRTAAAIADGVAAFAKLAEKGAR
ncbi:MAG: N-acetylmuramoyl-L-alanine amidase [Lentisphaeria bacterium]|nr:N-acetylmuramoyl-L-alanine amidase [Lentisphaeria bacterium]